MDAPISIKKSEVPFPCKHTGHGVVTWKHSLLVWGSWDGLERVEDVYFHIAGEWIKKETSGHKPISLLCEQAHVLNANMFVISQESQGSGSVMIYCLDLNTCKWTKYIPNGVEPVGSGYHRVSWWVHKDKLYFFGGRYHHDQQSNRIFCYNISTNSWEWPDSYGDIPSPRRHAIAISTKTVVALFGGITDGHLYNDLHILDKNTLRWKKVHGDIPIGQGPSWHGIHVPTATFTRITKSTAVLFDSLYNRQEQLVDDCWLFDIDKAEQVMDPSSIWTKIQIPSIFRRKFHGAALEPISRQLWVIGGIDMRSKVTSDVLQINLIKLTPLKDIAIHHAVQRICVNDPRLAEDKLPRHLGNEIEAYRSEILGDNACTLRNKCMACLPAARMGTMRTSQAQDRDILFYLTEDQAFIGLGLAIFCYASLAILFDCMLI